MAKKPASKSKPAAKKASAAANGGAAQQAAPVADATQGQASATGNPDLSPEVIEKIVEVRSAVRENFGKAVMSMMMLPRYRAQTLADLQHLVLDPLIQDRLSIAYPSEAKDGLADMSGFAIWASVSEEVDQKIREQIKAGVFPVRLASDEWKSGEINWLLDVVAKDSKTTASVIANFKQVVKQGGLRLHPMITRLVDKETLEKMGAERMKQPEAGGASAEADSPADTSDMPSTAVN
ncbi:MAG: toxin-activating lysine-acyltransferase [Pseudomonadota bacterium]